MKSIIGYYNENGYHVDSVDNGINNTLYSAGNSPYDSQRQVELNKAIPVEVLQVYCEQTAKEISIDYDIPFLGTEYEETSL